MWHAGCLASAIISALSPREPIKTLVAVLSLLIKMDLAGWLSLGITQFLCKSLPEICRHGMPMQKVYLRGVPLKSTQLQGHSLIPAFT